MNEGSIDRSSTSYRIISYRIVSYRIVSYHGGDADPIDRQLHTYIHVYIHAHTWFHARQDRPTDGWTPKTDHGWTPKQMMDGQIIIIDRGQIIKTTTTTTTMMMMMMMNCGISCHTTRSSIRLPVYIYSSFI